MSNPIEVFNLAGDLVSVYPKSLHVICRRFTFNDEVFVGYNIHACKANSSSDDVTLKTPAFILRRNFYRFNRGVRRKKDGIQRRGCTVCYGTAKLPFA